jgi:hypothetical protein
MTTRIVSGIAALLAALAQPVMAQDTSADPSLGLSLESSVVGGANAGPLDAQITGDNTYASLIAAINATESVDLSGITEETKLSIVKVSTLEGDVAAEGAALDAAVGARSEMLTTLRTNAGANAAISGKLLAEGFTVDDVLAIRTDASGNTLVYVDDR